jgi:hypothetical protein
MGGNESEMEDREWRMETAMALLPSSIFHPPSSFSVIKRDQRFLRSRRALRFLLPTLRRRRGLAMGESPFESVSLLLSVVRGRFVHIEQSRRVAYRGEESESSRRDCACVPYGAVECPSGHIDCFDPSGR